MVLTLLSLLIIAIEVVMLVLSSIALSDALTKIAEVQSGDFSLASMASRFLETNSSALCVAPTLDAYCYSCGSRADITREAHATCRPGWR